MSGHIDDRGKLMESLFFKQRDQALLERMREDRANKEVRDQLTEASGISDAAAIDALIKVDISADSLTAVSMIPLVAVAWADWEMDEREQEAVLQAADGAGIEKGSASYELLATWLKHRPGDDLLDAWKSYIKAIQGSMDAAASSQLKTSVIGRAEMIALSAGGFLGLGNKISQVERDVLDDLAATFD
jgi:hypothetical protein